MRRAAGLGQRLTRSRESGGEGTVKQQGIVPVHQALGDTLKHIHAFTHRHSRAQKRVLQPTATQTHTGISQGSPISSPVLGVGADRPSLLQFTKPQRRERETERRREPPLLSGLTVD